uniref:Transmembrane protein 231 n=1 Tax=Haemonchus contortus TaxID=6289 RepID=A0A7I4YMQ3_HAECO
MVHEVVHKEPLYRNYTASTASFAYATKLLFDFIRIFLPLTIIFATHGLWKKTGTYREKPQVTFDGRYLLVIGSTDQYSFTSTLPVLNKAERSHFVAAQLDYQWIPLDNFQDELQIDIAVSIPNVTVNELAYFIFLNYSLNYHSLVEAEVALYGSLPLLNTTSAVTVFGRLAADQTMPFRWREYYKVIEGDRRDVEHYTPHELALRITRLPFNVRINRKMQFQTSSQDSQIHLKLRVVISEDEFTYKTDIWELLKWAAVQYIVTFIVLNHLINSFLSCLFGNRLIEVVPCCKRL